MGWTALAGAAGANSSSMPSGGVGLGIGIAQYLKARKLEKSLHRPTMRTPDELRRNLEIALASQKRAEQERARASLTGLPGEGRILNKIEGAASNAYANDINTGQSPSSIIAGITGGLSNTQNEIADLGVKSAEFQTAQRNNPNAGILNADNLVMGANTNLATQSMNNFEFNENQPYQAKAAAISALRGAGLQNIQTGLEGNKGFYTPPETKTNAPQGYGQMAASYNPNAPVTGNTPPGATGTEVTGLTPAAGSMNYGGADNIPANGGGRAMAVNTPAAPGAMQTQVNDVDANGNMNWDTQGNAALINYYKGLGYTPEQMKTMGVVG